MVHCLGLPAFFTTISAADMHWPALHKLLRRKKEYSDNMKPVVEQPHAVGAFFVRRHEKMLKEIYGDKIKDLWLVYEWQSR